MDDGRPHLKLAFLGPRGTYSHQVAHDAFGDEVEYHSCKTIAETYHSVGSDFALGVIPHENSIFGTVVETYDLLRDLELGKSKWVRGALMLPIQHSLLVHRNRRLPDIKKVLSHEQALGQCSRFLQEQLPNAELVAVSSTAAAAERVSKDVEAFDHAAICSDFCTKLLPDLEVLHKGIQNEQRNFTRFYILSNREYVPLPRLATTDTSRHALLRVQPQLALVGHSLTIEQILRPLGMFISRIDRRPSQEREPFDDIYILEIFDTNTSEDMWENAVRQGMKRVVDVGGEVALLGLW